MNDTQKTALVSSLLSGALGILLTATIGLLIRRATLARRREEWLQSGQVGLASAMIGDQRIEQLGNSILEFLAPYLGAVAGALFVSGSENFRRASTYGVPKTADIPVQFKRREGVGPGQAAVENRPVLIGEVPEGYLAFGSALGQDKPKHLVIFPGSIDGNVNSVIELGFLRPVDESDASSSWSKLLPRSRSRCVRRTTAASFKVSSKKPNARRRNCKPRARSRRVSNE